MENKANYALIGAFVLAAFAATVAFVLWLTNQQFDQQFDEYQVYFSGPVRGLSPGSEVRFNGIKVGEVLSIRLDREDPNTVLADIQVDSNTPVDTKSYAQLEPLGLTGLNYVQIFSGGEQFPLIKDLPNRGVKRIEGQGAVIDDILSGGGSVVEEAQIALNRVNRILSPEAVDDIHAILRNVRDITGQVDLSEFDMNEVNGLIRDLRVTTRKFAETAEAVQGTAGRADVLIEQDLTQLLARVETTLAEADETLNAIEGAAGGADEMIVDARDAINRLSNSGLTDLEETVDAIRRLVLSLGRVADSLEQNPLTFISGTEEDIVELPQ